MTTRRSLIHAAAAAACVAAMPIIGARVARSFSAAAAIAPAQPGLLSSEFIYETAPYPSCHASTIAATKAGLVAAWFGGTRERAPDVGIWVARHQGGKWATPVEVVSSTQSDGSQIPSWNPVLFQPSKGPLLLFYKVGPSPSTWWGMLKTSSDNGNAWSDSVRLPDGILGPIKNKPVELADGSLLCPSSSEDHPEEPKWRVHFERTADRGKTWTTAAPPLPAAAGDKPVNAIQPSILHHGGSRLQAIGRTRSARLFESWSQDDGRTWTPVRLIDLPNPNSGTDAVTLRDGRHALIYNHNDKPKGRTPLNIAVSNDGKTWEAALVLESEPGEYSYPAMIQASDGLVHGTYTWKRERIKHVVIDPAKLQTRPMANGQWPAEATK
jgi:predicted neuraminidase